VISQLTDGFFCRRRIRPLVFIKTKWRRKKNDENHLFFDDFRFFSLTFFSINRYFRGYRASREITTHRQIFAPPPPSPTFVYYNRVATKIEW
jgi:hypothetical protein